ncbi:MAG: Gfo/Idh/MocA family oxidoreductase [Planctomycetia bacterium]|nr:Gfo/Idh/MocA family oxidoreductase [Planctomycetia bacterium]
MKKRSPAMSRRQFLAAGVTLCSLPLYLPGTVLGYNGGVSPANRINIFHIGLGNRGNELLGGFNGDSRYKVRGVCDCYSEHARRSLERLVQFGNTDAVIIDQYEEVLTQADIDAVVIATPDHWHTKIAIEACRAGKDVYCEKPLTLTLAEGRQIVAAARKYNRVCTGGSQRVMDDYGYMAPIIQSGAIGEVQEVFVGLGLPPKHCYLPEQPIPEGMDWDRWLGQAPWAPYNAERCSGDYGGGWRRYTEYGNGFLADWGAHKFAGVLYVLGLDDTGPVKIIPKGHEGAPWPAFVFSNGIKVHYASQEDYDITFVGTEGVYEHRKSTLKPLKAVEVRRYHGGETTIQGDFAYCVRNRLRPFQDFEYASRAAAVCQLLAICCKLNRPLDWDPDAHCFPSDAQAQRMVVRPQRAPYTICCE